MNKVTIVIPTYNEKENIPKIVPALFDLGQENLHILVVDDNSPDGTGQIAEELGKKYDGRVKVLHREGKQGLGTAYLAGFKFALEDGADAIGQMDADFSHPPEKVLELIANLENYDAVIGSRYVPGGALDEHWPLWRKWLSGFGNFYARTILNLHIRDTTGGFKLWKRATLENMPLERVKSNGYVFQVEMSYLAHKLGYKFTEIPIYFADRRWGTSKMSFRIQIEAAVRVWQLLFRYNDL
ncbi:MAG: polyprenol monophosphomannose synthase [Anaerolineaceae bacterium]|nr:polyprenol monophosphomannose synthase [Anaerolineaceae bacterium]